MQNIEDLCQTIAEIVHKVPDNSGHAVQIEPDTELLVLGLLDSLSTMQLTTAVERDTGVALPEEALVARNFRTPQALWRAIETHRAQTTETVA